MTLGKSVGKRGRVSGACLDEGQGVRTERADKRGEGLNDGQKEKEICVRGSYTEAFASR